MPKRLFDGDKAYRSDKLRDFARQHRNHYAHYAWLKGCVLADGTFEASAERVWSDAYSYVDPKFSVVKIEKMLQAFVNFGLLLRKKDENGKLWGYWTGSEECLPASGEQHKYKKGNGLIFKTRESVASASGVGRESLASGIGIGIGLGNGIGAGTASQDVTTEQTLSEAMQGDEQQTTVEQGKPAARRLGEMRRGAFPGTKPKVIHKHLAKAWQEVLRDEGALNPYPGMYPEKWEELCEQLSGDIIVPSFELWALQEGMRAGFKYPTSEFLKVSQKYVNIVTGRAQEVQAQVQNENKEAEEAFRRQHMKTFFSEPAVTQTPEEAAAESDLSQLL